MADAEKPNVEVVPIESVTLDGANANRGTARGRKLLKNSLRKLGAGRSILLDKNNTALAGNKTLEAARAQGFKRVAIVESDGKTLIAVRRTDLAAGDKKAQELAVNDNRVSEVDLSWDPEILQELEVDLEELWEPAELDKLLNADQEKAKIETIDMQEPASVLWILLGVPLDRFDLVQEHLAALENIAEISVQTARSDKKEEEDGEQEAASADSGS